MPSVSSNTTRPELIGLISITINHNLQSALNVRIAAALTTGLLMTVGIIFSAASIVSPVTPITICSISAIFCLASLLLEGHYRAVAEQLNHYVFQLEAKTQLTVGPGRPLTTSPKLSIRETLLPSSQAHVWGFYFSLTVIACLPILLKLLWNLLP